MVGSHLIKTWSKTQATIAKSSAESELYGIVRATCETLGLITLIEDLGGTASARLHMDATAARGIVDREGVSKVRHLDVNILWLQEQLARDKVPLLKVLGTENSADLATKHLSQDMIRKHTERMSLEFREGRAKKAVELKSIDKRSRCNDIENKMIATCDKYAERRGGDSWFSRGSEGTWVRLHSTPRRSLFTPCRVPRGPAHPDDLSTHRCTVGVDINGQSFRIQDDWTNAGDSHRILELPWTGTTTFMSKTWNTMKKKGATCVDQRWADIDEE
jgi:hypothetical protein